ncbi:SURF1 family protein [Pseudooceanicola aestuarii]|uniref:SURF1 family protein n=1 Tax=Pseudooceanicola aestuarii TaxID=2697319 RepID=UPI0013D05485|nr:SURF1 family protein [Pseudooceanicola aestuarii]
MARETKRIIGALVLGVLGVGVLLALGGWQLQRLEWKTEVLTQMEAQISGEPQSLPDRALPERDRFLPVAVEGQLGDRVLRVIATRPGQGPGHRLISALETGDGRRVLLERGFVAQGGDVTPPQGSLRITGNLHWPREVDSLTPPPDTDNDLWYARDVHAMARELGTEPFLIVARMISGAADPATPWPVDTSSVANDHLQYAITWFSLAAIWLVMTLYLIYRIRQQGKAER